MNIDNIFKFFIPRDDVFFPLFEKDVKNLIEITKLLCELMRCKDSSQWVSMIKKVKDLELCGDEITNMIYDKLDESFITPFDREDIHALASCIDDIADNINGGCNRIRMYKPQVFIPEFSQLATLLLEAAKLIEIAIGEIKKLKNTQKVTEICIELKKIEHLADELYQIAISRLFEKETNSIELIKIKDILERLEQATDNAKKLSDVLKSIVIKNT